MLARTCGTVDASSKRRSDTCNGTGLDYSTCYRVEADFPTRIHSLLLSRQTQYPPRTPWPSDEMAPQHQEDDDYAVDSFDLNTANSVAESACLESGRSSLPLKLGSDVSCAPEMSPVSRRNIRSALRRSSSSTSLHARDRSLDGVDATETGQKLDDVRIHQTVLTCCPPCPPSKATLGDSLRLVPRNERHFSLPGPSVRLVTSHSSLRAKNRPPSLETTDSKSSVRRHTLLKPSVAAWQLVDLGLPVQPVLVKAVDVLPIAGGSGIYNNSRAGHAHIHSQVTPVELLTNLLERPQANESACCSESTSTTIDQPAQTDLKSSLCLPKVQFGIEAATQVAVGALVSQAVSPATGELNRAPDAYRSLAPEPLAEAALRADEYLRRNFARRDESSIRREIEVSSVGELTSGVLSASTVAQLNAPNIEARDDFALFENLTPQDSVKMGKAVSRGERSGVPSTKRNSKIATREQSSKKPSFKYSTIPSRKSSLDRKRSVSITSSHNIPDRNHFLEKAVPEASKSVRSGSSISSSRINSAIIPNSRLSGNYGGDITSSEAYDNHLRMYWLPKLLSEHEPYSPRLTAIPPRKYRLQRTISKSRRRSETQDDAEVLQSEPKSSETFTKTIGDLENLMSEALHLAHQAGDRRNAEQIQGPLQDATVQRDPIRKRGPKGRLRSVIYSQLPDISPDQESAHESISSVLNNSASHDSDRSHYIYEGHYLGAPSEFANPSDGNVMVMQHAVMSPTQFTWPLIRDSTSRAVPVLSGLKAICAGILYKSARVKVTNQRSISDKASVISMTAAVPTIRPGNTEMSQHIKSETPLTLPTNERWRDEQSANIRLQHKKSVDKKASPTRQPYEEDIPTVIKAKRPSKAILNKREVTEFIRVFHQPPIQPRHSSLALRKMADTPSELVAFTSAVDFESSGVRKEVLNPGSLQKSPIRPLSISQGSVSEVGFPAGQDFPRHAGLAKDPVPDNVYELEDANQAVPALPKRHISGLLLQDKFKQVKNDKLSHLNLQGRSHISIRDQKGFSLSRSHRRQPIARDWSPARKRFSASVACISTALVGILVGIYAGEVPSIQYYIADFNHFAILGNVFFFITLSITTFLFWPLPLLHGRKPYILGALTIAMPLLFPQAISVSMQRSPYVATWRILLILPRTLMGAALGFANMNFMATLTDLFGASLQSENPHQETVDEFDVRRHGGGLGVWLGIWTWCYIGSIGVGFLIGALVINTLSPDWGFYVSIVIIAATLLLNVVTPEVRRSAYRRSVTEVRTPADISRRLARGEVMMHRLQTGPKWWGQELHQGVMLSLDMLRQPGFLVMSFYVAWMYGQIVLIIALLGSLMSKYYHFTSPEVGATTMAIPIGALLAVPFQKASLFSRARRRPQRTDSMTFNTKVTFSSHLVRRAIFTLVLPFAGLGYTLSSSGPPTPFILPVLFAGLIGFLSNLAIAECNGIIMETFDTSDLQPGMTGRPRGASGERTKYKRTNYSSFPRVSSAFAIIQAFGFLIGAAATGVGGVAERHIGQQAATGVMAGILLIQTIGMLGVLYRFKEVQIIPNHNAEDMKRWERERKLSVQRQEEAIRQGTVGDPRPELEEPWRPIIIGNPSGKTRRMSILELGHLSRWSEIRRKNRLVDEMSREARFPNLAILEDVRKEIIDKNLGSLQRRGSRRSQLSRSYLSQASEEPERDDEVELDERSKSA